MDKTRVEKHLASALEGLAEKDQRIADLERAVESWKSIAGTMTTLAERAQFEADALRALIQAADQELSGGLDMGFWPADLSVRWRQAVTARNYKGNDEDKP